MDRNSIKFTITVRFLACSNLYGKRRLVSHLNTIKIIIQTIYGIVYLGLELPRSTLFCTWVTMSMYIVFRD